MDGVNENINRMRPFGNCILERSNRKTPIGIKRKRFLTRKHEYMFMICVKAESLYYSKISNIHFIAWYIYEVLFNM